MTQDTIDIGATLDPVLLICKRPHDVHLFRDILPDNWIVRTEGSALAGFRIHAVFTYGDVDLDSNWFQFQVRCRFAHGKEDRIYAITAKPLN